MKNILRTITNIALLLSTITAASQENSDTTARNRLDNYIVRTAIKESLFPEERVYLHFDNTAYYLGENMWFKAYIFSGTENSPTTMSKVLYVELVAPEGYVVRTNKYKIEEDGTCSGMFELNTLLLSGYYEIRAYTRYMLNRGKDAIFSRVFPVFDKVNNGDWTFKNMLDRRRAFLVDIETDSSRVGLERETKWVNSKLPETDIRFFPEGGHLVEGIECNVAYELFGADGINSGASITVYADGEELLTTTPEHLGKGSFKITPQKGVKYTARANIKKKSKKFKLPKTCEEGAVIEVDNSGNNVKIAVRNNLEPGTELGCAVLYRGKTLFYERFPSTQRDKLFAIGKSTLAEGVNRVVLFVNDSIPLAERQFFVTHSNAVEGDNGTARLAVTGNGYHIKNLEAKPYEKITLNIEREDGKPIESGNFSLSVTDANSRQQTSYSYNIYTYMLLGSEIKGYIPNAAQYFDTANSNRERELDLVMLTHGWTSYDWSKLSKRETKLLEPIEKGITIKGRFIKKEPNRKFGKLDKLIITNRPNTKITFQIPYDDGNISVYDFKTDENGEFRITTKDFTGKKVAKLTPRKANSISPEDSVLVFSLDRYFSPEMRLYSYWERNVGLPVTAEELALQKEEMIKLNPFEYLLSQVEVISKKKHDLYYRPPRSEIRLDFLDEWEYAQDVTYLCNDQDNWDIMRKRDYDYRDEPLWMTPQMNDNPSLSSFDHAVMRGSSTFSTPTAAYNPMRTPGFRNIATLNPDENYFISDPAYRNSLNAGDILRSAFWRHNLNWCYWIQGIVVDGEYSSDEVPTPDEEWLKGVEPAKMMNFKEIIIRSDEKTRRQFGNGIKVKKTKKNIGAFDYSDYYDSFTRRMPIGARNGNIDEAPDNFEIGQIAHEIGNMTIPNYVACFIPNSEEDKEKSLVPLLTVNSSARYTMVYGYTESKEFYSPDYSKLTPDTAVADFRRTLLWCPNLEAKDGKLQAELYNNSTATAIAVDVEGYADGTFFSNNTATKEVPERDKAIKDATEEIVSIIGISTPQLLAECFKSNEEGRMLYRNGEYGKAFALFNDAAALGYADAIFNIGVCYMAGLGVEQDSVKGFKSFRKAANLGQERAFHNLASCYFYGIGTPQNDTLAIKYYKESAERGNAISQTMLALCYERGRGTEKDTLEAARWYAKAAENEEPTALYAIAEMYAKKDSVAGLSKGELRKQPAIGYYRKAAEKGHVLAQYKLGRFYDTGYYVRKSRKKAFKWYVEAANKMHLQAMERVAYCYEKGRGTKKNERSAVYWYRVAEDSGSQMAKERMYRYNLLHFLE